MKKCFIYVIAAISALVVSCNKEVDTLDNNTGKVDQNLVSMTFKAAMEGPATKTTLDVDDGSVAWAATDQVKFIWELDKTPNSAVSSNTEIDGDVATFTATVPSAFNMTEAEYKGEDDSKSLHLYAVYPSTVEVDYHKESDNGMHFFLTVPTEQDGTFANASIALAKWDNTNPAADLVFKNLCGLLQIKITDDSVRKIVLHSDDNIAGKMDITFTGPAVKEVSDGKKDITVNVTNVPDEDDIYYIAVLPTDASKGIGVTNMYVELLDENDELIGDKATSNPLVIARKQIRKLGTIATGFSDRFYVKVDGEGEGTSWGDAANFSKLQTLLGTSGINKKVYLAAGVYTVKNVLVNPTGSSFSLYGGYDNGKEGHSINGRDIKNNATIFDGGKNDASPSSARILALQNGAWVFDGITFQNAWYWSDTYGCALVLAGATSATINNCTFKDNVHRGTTNNVGGSAVRVGTCDATFNHCLFENNRSNKSTAGAIYVMDGRTIKCNECSFVDNSSIVFPKNTTDLSYTDKCGGAIYGAGTAKIFLNKCYFSNNVAYRNVLDHATAFYGAQAIGGSNQSTICLYNCVLRGPWGKSPTAGSMISGNGNLLVASSTLYSQLGSVEGTPCGVISTNVTNTTRKCELVNNIILNAAGSGAGKPCYNVDGSMNVNYSIITSDGKELGATIKNSIVNANPNTAFPTSSHEWASDAQRKGTEFPTNDIRTSIYYFRWTGSIPAALGEYSSISKSLLEEKINNVDSNFLTWINELNALAVDIRGNARNTAAMWPGSYEE